MTTNPLDADPFGADDTTAADLAAVAPAPIVPNNIIDPDMIALSKAVSTPAEVKVPGMTRPFRPHQAAAFTYLLHWLSTKGRGFAGHDMGLGKTQVALALIAWFLRLAKGKGATHPYALVVAPPVAFGGFMSDLKAAFPHLKMVHLVGRKVFTPEPADIYFLNDDPLSLRAWLCRGEDEKGHLIPSTFATGASFICRDEIHRDKGGDSKPSVRGRVMLAVSEALRLQGTPVLGMTGTLLVNKPSEGYYPLQIVGGPQMVLDVTPGASSMKSYLWRYCGATTKRVRTRGGWKDVTDFRGCDVDRMHELHDLLCSNGYSRADIDDIGVQMPESTWLLHPIALEGTPDPMLRYRRIVSDILGLIAEEKGEEAAWRAAGTEVLRQMGLMWQECGNMKVDACIDFTADLVSQGRPVVLFHYHLDDKGRPVVEGEPSGIYARLLDGFAKRGIECSTINGRMGTGARRLHEIEAFQAGDTQVCLAQIRAAGQSVTLTAAADAVFLQVPWSSGDLAQASRRILRCDDRTYARAANGERITWHVLQAMFPEGDPTFDQAMWSVLQAKCRITDAANARRPVTMSEESIMQAMLHTFLASARH